MRRTHYFTMLRSRKRLVCKVSPEKTKQIQIVTAVVASRTREHRWALAMKKAK